MSGTQTAQDTTESVYGWFEAGNYLCLAGYFILLVRQIGCYLEAAKQKKEMTKLKDENGGECFKEDIDMPLIERFAISPDTMVMLAIGAWARFYWSVSPDPVWDGQGEGMKYRMLFDLVCTMAVTTLILIFGAMTPKIFEAYRQPQFTTWSALTFFAILISLLLVQNFEAGSVQLEEKLVKVVAHLRSNKEVSSMKPDELKDYAFVGSVALDSMKAWPHADMVCNFCILMEGFALIPQVNMLRSKTAEISTGGLLFAVFVVLGRFLRLDFWWKMTHTPGVTPIAMVWKFYYQDVLNVGWAVVYLWICWKTRLAMSMGLVPGKHKHLASL